MTIAGTSPCSIRKYTVHRLIHWWIFSLSFFLGGGLNLGLIFALIVATNQRKSSRVFTLPNRRHGSFFPIEKKRANHKSEKPEEPIWVDGDLIWKTFSLGWWVTLQEANISHLGYVGRSSNHRLKTAVFPRGYVSSVEVRAFTHGGEFLIGRTTRPWATPQKMWKKKHRFCINWWVHRNS